jgi:uncharacterized protein
VVVRAAVIRRSSDRSALAELDWDRLAGPEDFFLTSAWMAVIQATGDTPLYYLSAHRADPPLAGLATALADIDAPWSLGRPDTLLGSCQQQGMPGTAEVAAALPGPASQVLMPSLVCGGRHIGRTRLLLAPTADVGEAAALLEHAEELAGQLSARSICLPYVDERDAALREALAERGYLAHVSGEYASLPLPAGGLAGYLRGLSQHRSQRIRAERRRLAAVGVEFGFTPLADCDIDRLAVLETELMVKYGLTGWQPRHSAAALRAVRDVLGDRALVSYARDEGVIVGFGLLLTHQDQWFAHRTGFDYHRRKGLPLYFELLYYRPIELAPSYGITAVHYGVGSAEAKRSRGCTMTTQYSYLKWHHDGRH